MLGIQKRAQISIFIILGILIIAIFGFMFFLTSEVGRIKLETQANQIVDSVLATTSINYYVTLCLEEATKSAINLSGEKGGMITDAQIAHYLEYRVNSNNPGPDAYPCNANMPNFSTTPQYCLFLDNINKFPSLINTTLGQTGISISPMLCERNDQCAEVSDFNISIQGVNATRHPLFFDSLNSIQKEIENYTAYHVYNCSKGILNVSASNLTAFKKFNITAGQVNVSTVFGYNGIEVTADYPLIIKIQDVEPIIRILKFSYFSPVRYKYVYLLARWVAEQESSDLDFAIESDWQKNSAYALEGFLLSTNRMADGNTSVIIQDRDKNHLLRAGPFEFKFVIENRPPVLDYIQEYDVGEYGNYNGRDYDVYTVEGTTVELRPKGYDPDGDPINYSYSGWKETSDAYFDNSLLPSDGCRNFPQQCVVPAANVPHNWTQSSLFTDSSHPETYHRAANYQTNHSDIGIHIVKICVNETTAPFRGDCQNVRIFVDDKFLVIANITMSRCFAGITNNSLISVEDPVCLDSDVIDYFNPKATKYLWSITPETARPSTIYDGKNDSVNLPRDYEPGRYKPGLVNYFTQANMMKFFNLGVLRGIGPGATSGTDQVNATARQCIPYRGITTVGGYKFCHSYPFNDIDYGSETSLLSRCSDPFLGNHTCCEGNIASPTGDDWARSDKGKECFNYDEYGWFNASFVEIGEQAGKSFTNDTKYAEIPGTRNTPVYPQDNDIVLRNFTSYCNGTSGNVCNYNTNANYSIIVTCPDKLDQYYLQRCQGANKTAKHYAGATPACEQFTDTTFEQYVGQTDNPVCGPARCTSDQNVYENERYTWDKANWLCNATCNSGDCDKVYDCVNCRTGGLCTKPGPQNVPDAYKVRQITTARVKECSPRTDSDVCQLRAENTLEDRCDATDSDKLIEYGCHAPLNYPEANFSTEVSCSGTFETPAIINAGTCTPGNKSTCQTGACVILPPATTLVESCDTPNKIYYNVTVWDTNSNGIFESCLREPVRPPFDQEACLSCNYQWISGSCCGDAAGEICP